MASKKKEEQKTQYEIESTHNRELFIKMLKVVRPDIYVLMDMLDKTKINYLVLFQVIRHLNNLTYGGGYGKVIVEVQDGVVSFVRGEESSKLNEKLKLEIDN